LWWKIIVVASGYIDPDRKSRIKKARAKYFIEKPYRPKEVLQKLRGIIDCRESDSKYLVE